MENIYLAIPIKMLAGFILLVAYIQLSGKGSLAPISSLDQVGNVVLGAIIGGSLYNPAINVILLVAVAGAWAGLILLVRFLTFKKWSIKNMVDGKSIRLMENGRLVTENFSQARLSPRDFIMLLHQRGYSNLDELRNVWFEYNGQMTVVKKGDEAMAIVLIENGQIDEDNMEFMGFEKNWLLGELTRQNYALQDVFVGEWHDGKLWLYPY